MKIGIFLEGSNSIGGGFFQSLQSALLILSIEKYKNDIELIITESKTIDYIKDYTNKYKILNIAKSKILKYFCELFEIDLVRNVFNKLKIFHPFYKFLKKNNYDLIIFLGPSTYSKYCADVSFILNIYDLDHKKNSQFPEHNLDFNFENREKFLQESMFRAFRIIVAHENNKSDLINYYNLSEENVVIQNFIPFLPTFYKTNKFSDHEYQEIYYKFKIPKNRKIIFYPAQFWAHKNHKYILDAAKILKENNDKRFYFVFCGKNKGNLKYVKDFIKDYELDDYFMILNFLDDKAIISFYLNSSAIVMPTYCGPTNLPIYESFYFKKLIFYTKNLISDDILNKHLVPIDISSPLDLVKKLEFCLDDKKIESITKNNFKYYEKACSEQNFRKTYEKIINDYYYLLKRWKNN
jgi:glycosyltransferase involved in cell wall biosynthesis